MNKNELLGGTVHKMPNDLKKALFDAPRAASAWQGLTPLARNEWICWNTTVKQQATRDNHIKRTITELQQGKRRPCCWMGCIHRQDKELSPSIKWVLSRKK